MPTRFTTSNMKREIIRFTVQIGSYSTYTCKGYYTSPEFSGEESESTWSLIVYVYDGDESFIDVRLKRDSCATEQCVNVKVSIVNCFGISVFRKDKKHLFKNSNETGILSVVKEDLQGYYGLKKFYYLPKDTLTLQCELTVYENGASSYEKEESFSDKILRCVENYPEYFTHSRLVEGKKDYFVWDISDFYVRCYGGECISPGYESEILGEGKWSLVVYNMTHCLLGELFDIRLVRRDSYEPQMVKAKLSILDRSGDVILYKEKNINFTSPKEEQMLSLSEKNFSSWFGLRKKRLIPNDQLTLRCDITLYQQVDDNFDMKEDFDNSVRTHGYALIQMIPYMITFSLILAVLLQICTQVIAKLPYVWYFLEDVVFLVILHYFQKLLLFLFGVVMLMLIFKWIVNKYEDIMRQREIERKRKERENQTFIEYPRSTITNYVRNGLSYHRKRRHSNRHYNQPYITY